MLPELDEALSVIPPGSPTSLIGRLEAAGLLTSAGRLNTTSLPPSLMKELKCEYWVVGLSPPPLAGGCGAADPYRTPQYHQSSTRFDEGAQM